MPKEYISPDGHPAPTVYTHLVKADRLLFISGQVGFREQRRLVEGGIEAQTRQALDNIGQLLAAGGAAWTDVVKLTIYLVDMAHIGVVRQVRGEYYTAVGMQPPATTTVGVTGLAAEGALIEIEAMAVLDLTVQSTTPISPERALADLLADTWREERAGAEADLASVPAQLAELSRRFVELDRRLLAARHRLDQSDSDVAAAERRATAELTRLRAFDTVAELEVQVERRRLLVVTRPIHLAWSGRRFDLGRFRLVVDLAGDIRIESVDHLGPRSGWDHPHVQDSLPCLGNLREGILKLVAEYELALAVQVLLDFLATYTPETAYTPIEGWPQLP